MRGGFERASGLLVAAALALSLGTAVACAESMQVGGTGAAHGILQRLGDAFSIANPDDRVEVVAGLGTSGGIAATAEGFLQIAISARELKAAEREKGLSSTPFIDTPFVFVSSHPQPQKLTTKDIPAIYAGTFNKWPDGSIIKPVLRPRADAVPPFLITNIPGMDAALEEARRHPEIPVAGTDQDNLKAAEDINNSFAGMTLAQHTTERPKLQMIELDGVYPSVEAMENGHYRLIQTLYVVTKSPPSALAQRFLDFINSRQGRQIIRESGGRPALIRVAPER